VKEFVLAHASGTSAQLLAMACADQLRGTESSALCMRRAHSPVPFQTSWRSCEDEQVSSIGLER